MPDNHHHALDDEPDAALADLLDLDGDALHSYWTAALTWVRHEVGGSPRRRVLDIGAGTGTGTIQLAQRFEGAEVVAVDVSDSMLGRIRAKALDLGLAPRVRTIRADLDAGWPALDPVDVVWASMSLHHLADPDRVLRELFAVVRPGGFVAVAEFSTPLRYLPDDLGIGRPGLEQRCLAVVAAQHAEAVPALGSDWPARLGAAGFAVQAEREFVIALDAPHPPAVRQLAWRWFDRLRSGLAERLDPDDRAALDALLGGDGPDSLARRDDLTVRGTRTVTLARRP